MKRLAILLSGLCCAALVGYAAASLRAIPFQITSQQFEEGDTIIVQQVMATSSDLQVGDTVVVRGRYHLQSRSRATLGFFLTTPGPSAPTPISTSQRSKIEAGDGTFELVHVVPSEGRLHVSFYPLPNGSSFGGVYFGPATP